MRKRDRRSPRSPQSSVLVGSVGEKASLLRSSPLFELVEQLNELL